jgi:hypothetical protein
MTGGKIYVVWCQPYDDGAQDIRVFAIKEEAEEYQYKIGRELAKERIPAIMEMTEAFIMFPTNIMPFDKDELECN